MTQTMKASDVRSNWSQLLNKVFRGETEVVVEKSGIPVAAVISAEDLDRLTKLENQRAQRFKVLDEIGQVFQDIPAKQLLSKVSEAINQVRSRET